MQFRIIGLSYSKLFLHCNDIIPINHSIRNISLLNANRIKAGVLENISNLLLGIHFLRSMHIIIFEIKHQLITILGKDAWVAYWNLLNGSSGFY